MGCAGSKKEARLRAGAYTSSSEESTTAKAATEEETEAEAAKARLEADRDKQRMQFEEGKRMEEERQQKRAAKMAALEEEERKKQEAEDLAELKEIICGAAMTAQAAIRGTVTRARLAKSGNPALVAVVQKAFECRQAELRAARAAAPAAAPYTKVQRSNSFGMKGRRAASRVQRAKTSNTAQRKMSLDLPVSPGSAGSPRSPGSVTSGMSGSEASPMASPMSSPTGRI